MYLVLKCPLNVALFNTFFLGWGELLLFVNYYVKIRNICYHVN